MFDICFGWQVQADREEHAKQARDTRSQRTDTEVCMLARSQLRAPPALPLAPTSTPLPHLRLTFCGNDNLDMLDNENDDMQLIV